MAGWIIAVVVVIIVAIIFLTGDSPFKPKSREEYLGQLCKYLDGQLSPLIGDMPGYQIAFNFEGRDFIFQDVEQDGYQEKVHKGYLKLKAQSSLTMNFTEAARMTLRSKVVQASDVGDEPIEKLMVPKELKKFKINSSDLEKVNALFDDPKILKLFVHYYNTGSRGEPAMSLRIQDGLITLEFFESMHMRPNLYDLMQSPGKIENELFNAIALAKALEIKLDGS